MGYRDDGPHHYTVADTSPDHDAVAHPGTNDNALPNSATFHEAFPDTRPNPAASSGASHVWAGCLLREGHPDLPSAFWREGLDRRLFAAPERDVVCDQ